MEILYSDTPHYTRQTLIDRLLVAVTPTGQGDYEEVVGLYDMGHWNEQIISNIVR